MRAAFFFGSGISIRSNAASVDDLTVAVCSGKWMIDGKRRIIPAKAPAKSDKHCRRLQTFLREIEAMLAPRLKAAKKECNYEDLFAALVQLDQDERGEIISPLIFPFSKQLKARVGGLGLPT